MLTCFEKSTMLQCLQEKQKYSIMLQTTKASSNDCKEIGCKTGRLFFGYFWEAREARAEKIICL